MRLALAFSLSLVLSLSACSWVGLEEKDFDMDLGISEWFDDTPRAPAPLGAAADLYAGCPQVATIRDLTIYQHPALANENTLVISARMGKIQAKCNTVADGLEVQASFDIVALKGNNSANNRANLPFFVSVVNAREEVLRRDVYEIPVEFTMGQRQARLAIPFSVVTPPADGSGVIPRVLIGFQLSPEQLSANTNFFASGMAR